MNFVREKVSKNKIRFKEDGFDLDLTYITPRIIAMGFPSSDVEGLYRNPIGEVYRFFETRHKNRYKLYNLCAEREYDVNKFHGRVSRYPFEDHNAPPIQLIVDCCKDISKWLSEDENNVVGINCKAGKGRTGLIICCYLMHSGIVETSDDAMLYYGTRRTKDGKGVTIASQKRYVKYYETVLSKYNGEAPPPRKLKLTRLRVHTVPNFSGKPFVLIEKGKESYSSPAVEVSKKDDVFEINVDCVVMGDIKVQLCARKSKKRHQKMCHFWFSTAFIDEETNSLILEKSEIDVANKDKKNAHFKENFKIEAYFENIDEPKLISSKKVSKRKSNKKLKRVKSKKRTSEKKTSKSKIKEETDNPKPADEDKNYIKRKRAQSFYDSDDECSSGSDKDEKMMNMYFKEEEEEDETDVKEEVEEEEEENVKENESSRNESKKVQSDKVEKKVRKPNGVSNKKSEKSVSKKKLK